MEIFGVSLYAPKARPLIDTVIFWRAKGVVSYVCFAVPKFSKFKCFHSSRKYDFTLLVREFVAITPANAPHCRPCVGLSQNIFAEVADSFMLLIYLSLEPVRYIP